MSHPMTFTPLNNTPLKKKSRVAFVAPILLTALLTTCGVFSQAQAATPQRSQAISSYKAGFKTGPIMGMGLGYSHLSGKTTENIFFPFPSTNTTNTKKTRQSNGFGMDLFTGYRWILKDRFMVGGDITLSKDTNTLKHTFHIPADGSVNTTTLNRTFSVTPALTAGYILSNGWMVYGKLGLSLSRFHLDNKLVDDETISDHKTFTQWGVKETLGVEYAWHEKASVFTEISCEHIKSKKISLAQPDSTLNDSTHHVKIKPRYVTAKLGVIFKF